MMNANSIYRFRLSVQDQPPFKLMMHIFVRHNQPPHYLALLHTIEQHSQIAIDHIQNHYIVIIEKSGICKYFVEDELSLRQAFRFISNRDNNLEIKLIKRVNNIQHLTSYNVLKIVKPIFTRRASILSDVEEVDYQTVRRDSGISLDDDFEKLSEQQVSSQTLPVLSPIDTARSSPIHTSNSKPKYTINLPRLSSIITDQSYSHKQAPPILSPPPLFLLDKNCIVPPSPSNKNTRHKAARTSSTSCQSQFICRHVIDQAIGKLCYQSFRRSYDLSRHQTIHLKNRPLCYCQHCNKKFTRLDALRRHERIQGHGSSK